MKVEVLGQFMLFGASELKRSRKCINCKKRLPLEQFYKKTYRCKECHLKYSNEYNKKHKKTLERKKNEKISTPEGAIHLFYGQISNKISSKKKQLAKRGYELTDQEIEKYYSCKVTEERLYEIWKEQEAKYGMHCPMTKQKMTFLRRKAGRQGPGSAFTNSVSIDRLNPELCYEEPNIIFVANEFNMRKNRTTFFDALKIVEAHLERWPEIYKRYVKFKVE